MKITLHQTPEGFEAEAEITLIIKRGEWCLDVNGRPIHYLDANCSSSTAMHLIRLTPKKRKYWRLDPVAFEEATKLGGSCDLRLGVSIDDQIRHVSREANGYTFLRLTEHTE